MLANLPDLFDHLPDFLADLPNMFIESPEGTDKSGEEARGLAEKSPFSL